MTEPGPTPPSPDRTQSAPARGRTLLRRLRHDAGGNTLAMMAAALIPMTAMAGSAIDMSRLYVVRVRLQQACDAGVLAGRKFLADSDATTLDANAEQRARDFFANNFRAGMFGSTAVSFDPAKTSERQVSGTARATVPMTLMRMFGREATPLTVTCEARYDIADIDTVFVLDTTGSMSCAATDTSCRAGAPASYTRSDGTTGWYATEQSGSKIQGLREAVILFDKTMRDNADPSTNIRYGFVTYASSVNVGRIIPSAYLLSDSYTYQSRRAVGDNLYGEEQSFSKTMAAADCRNGRWPVKTTWPDGTDRYIFSNDGVSGTSAYSAGSADYAYVLRNAAYSGGRCTGYATYYTPKWRHRPWAFDISQYVLFRATENPTRYNGSKSTWQGCIEEAKTRADATFDIASLPDDLNPDLIPSSSDNKWKPAWPDIVWDRDTYATADYNSTTESWNYASETRQKNGYAACGMPAKTLAKMSAKDVSDYVKDPDFKALGGTYHDVGMIWGNRLLSRKGVFASTNGPNTGRELPNRAIVFMTDGDMSPNQSVYGLYGIEDLDRRVTGDGTADRDLARHNARFLAECKYAREKMNVTVYVVAFGTALSSDLESCSPGNAYAASDTPKLKQVFKTIATKVAMLRIAK